MRRKNATTEFLKECMADALLLLLKEKPMEQITISEIADRADVGRVTFYRHFRSKEDLIDYKFHLIGDQMYSRTTQEQRLNGPVIVELFFEEMYAVRDMLITLYQANQYHTVLLALHRAHLEHNRTKSGAEAYYNTFWIYGLYGIMTEWVNTGCKKRPKELAHLAMQAIDYKMTFSTQDK